MDYPKGKKDKGVQEPVAPAGRVPPYSKEAETAVVSHLRASELCCAESWQLVSAE